MRDRPIFDADEHTYTLGGAVLPSVTGIIRRVMQTSYGSADEWHLARGRAVHACAEMIGRGVSFESDPQIRGRVAACRAWYAMRKPEVVDVERMVWRVSPIPYAGTLDLLCRIRGELWIIDWKSTASAWDKWQLGGYADALAEDGIEVKKGLVVTLNDDGTPKEGAPVDLRRARNEWRSILNVYQMTKREGLLK